MLTPDEQLAALTEVAVRVETPEELAARLRLGRPLRVKAGFDPSAPNIHLGHSIPLDVLRQFQDMGHTVVLIVGDLTARVGDPSGKLKTRPMLTDEELEANARTYFEQVGRIIDVDRAEIRGNSEWLEQLDLPGVLRLCSSYTVARVLERDTFQERMDLDEPITITELLYPLMQGYDSVAVEADVEIGGTDQLFNLLAARDVQRFYGQEPQVIMTFPLLVGLDGVEKMSSSLGNYVGITDEPSDMFGKLMSINDEVMLDYYRLLLKSASGELEQMRRQIRAGEASPRDLKAEMARRIVARFHDEAAATAAQQEFDRVFAERQQPSEMPDVKVRAQPVPLVELIRAAGFAASNSEARRLVTQGAVSLDDERLDDPQATVAPSEGTVLRVGKRRFARIVHEK